MHWPCFILVLSMVSREYGEQVLFGKLVIGELLRLGPVICRIEDDISGGIFVQINIVFPVAMHQYLIELLLHLRFDIDDAFLNRIVLLVAVYHLELSQSRYSSTSVQR